MKNVRIIEFVLIVLIISTLISCQSSVNNGQDIADNNQDSTKNDVVLDSYDISAPFYNLVENNPIDSWYQVEMDKGVENISEIVRKYTSLWIEEFDSTLLKCNAILSDDKAQEISGLLAEWKNTELSIWKWQKEEIFKNSSSIYGTQMYYDELKTVGDEFREKTIWLKHQLYIVETAENSEIPINELQSVTFSVTT